MSLTTAIAPEDLGVARITARGLLKSELTKLRSTRSLWITLTVAFTMTVGLCIYLILDGETLNNADGMPPIPFGWTAIYPVGMLALVIFGVLTMTNEYSTGSIRTSLVAAPGRTGVLLAKVAIVTGVTIVLAVLTSLACYVLLQVGGTVPSAQGVSLFHPDMFWGALGGTLILPYGALFGLLLGGLVRNAAAAIVLYFGFFQMGQELLPAVLPESLGHLVDYMPMAAIDVFRSGGLASEPYGTTVSIVVLVSWLVVMGATAWWLLKKRDV